MFVRDRICVGVWVQYLTFKETEETVCAAKTLVICKKKLDLGKVCFDEMELLLKKQVRGSGVGDGGVGSGSYLASRRVQPTAQQPYL